MRNFLRNAASNPPGVHVSFHVPDTYLDDTPSVDITGCAVFTCRSCICTNSQLMEVAIFRQLDNHYGCGEAPDNQLLSFLSIGNADRGIFSADTSIRSPELLSFHQAQ